MTYVSVFDDTGNGSQDDCSFYSLAIEFLEAACLLHATPPIHYNYAIVIYYLAGHSAELLLKAFLYRRSVPISQLKKLGHNLEELISTAREHHLPNQLSLSHVLKLAQAYSTKEFEYRRHAKMIFPDSDLLLDEVSRLAREVFQTITHNAT